MAPRTTLAAGFVASGLLLLPWPAAAMDIIPAFDSSITNAPNAQDIESSINASTTAVGNLFSNPGTVRILFEYEAPTNSSFLGESFNQTIPLSYSAYTTLLENDSHAHPENTALATAIANLGSGNDANGAKPVSSATAMLRVALGDTSATPCFDAQGDFVNGCNSTYDGVIVLNSSANLDFTRPVPAFNGSNEEYDAIETEEHEIDEVLGGGGWGTTLASSIPGDAQGVDFGPTDLYRYSAPGTKSYVRSPAASSYFSIDGGQTDIVGFSQLNDGSDYGDWGPDITTCAESAFVGGPGYVQDTDSCSNKQSDVTNASPEFTMLEALGYDPSAAALMPVIAWNCATSPDATNYSGTINAIKEGSCTQVVTGDSTFTGGTNIDTGTLQLGNGGTTGSVSGDITDSGTLVFNHSNTITYGGTISGGGALKQSGSGLLILTGDNTFTGLTTIALGAALQLGDGGTSGSLAGDVANHGALIFDRSDTLTYGGAISGQGNVQVTGGGTLIFTGNDTYTGGTTIASGTLQIGDGGTQGVIQGAVTDSGTLAFDRSDTITFKAQISGSGALAQIGTGLTILTAANSYTGGTLIGAGTLQIGNAKTTGMIAGDVLDNGVLAFDRTDNISFSGTISGSGSVQQLGTGTLTLTGNSTYSGGTTLGTGTLEAANSNAFGTGVLSLNGTPATLLLDNAVNLANSVSIAQAAFIVVNGTDSATLSGVLSGSAPFEKDGTGTLAITGNNTATYTGDISFHGTLFVGATGALGSGTVTVLGSTVVLANGVTYTNPTVLADDLTVEQDSGAATITGPISSNGAGNWGLTKTGAGSLTLANVNSFVGQTVVENGLLVVAGVLPGSVTVESGASVAVTGVVGGNVTVLAGGTMAPFALGAGYARATLASYSETDGTLSIRFGGSSAAFANDTLIVPGTVTLNGGTLDPHPSTPATDFTFDRRYVVIETPNAIVGSFANPSGFVANPYDPALLQRVRYDLGGVVLEIRRPIDFNAVSNTANEHEAAGAINSTESSASDDWAAVVDAVSSLSPADQAKALQQIGGEGLVDASHVAGDSLEVFDESLRAHMLDIGGDVSGRSAPLGEHGRLWVATLGRDEQTSEAGYADFRSQVGQFAFGADTTMSGDLTLGAAASIGRPSLAVPSLDTAASGPMNAYGAYGRYDLDAFYVSAAVTGDDARLHVRRSVSFGTVTDALSANIHQHAVMASAEIDARGAAGDDDLQPFARISYLTYAQGAFREADSGAGLGLNVAPLSHELWTGAAGGRWSRIWRDDAYWFAPRASAAVALNAPNAPPETGVALQGAPTGTGTFTVSAPHEAPIALFVGAGIAAGLAGTPVALSLDYEGNFSARAHASDGVLNVSYSW